MKIDRILITPELARQWLDKHNGHNRKASLSHIGFLANQMKAGKWMDTGDSIKFAENGDLLDGQHRLMAIVKSGISIEQVVAREIQNEAFQVIDTGKLRSGADTLHVSAIFNAPMGVLQSLAGAVRIMIGASASNAEILAFTSDNREMCSQGLAFLSECGKKRKEVVRDSTLLASFFLLIQKGVPNEYAAAYLQKIVWGIGLDQPQTRVRDTLISMRRNETIRYTEQAMWWVLTGWNIHAKEKKPLRIKTPPAWDRPDIYVPATLQLS